MPERSENTTPRGSSPALDRLVRIMFVNMAIGLLAAVCTWIFHDRILSYQLAGVDPTGAGYAAMRDTLSTTLWSRPGPAAGIAVLFPLLVRRLRSGRRRSYRRVVIIAVLQLLSVGWLTVGGDYPTWLRVLYLVQAVAVVATFVASTRHGVRELFGYKKKVATGHPKAALFLAVSTPVAAELAFGSTPITLAWLIVLWTPFYGCGVLLIRELVVRSGRGWPSVLLLAVAFEIAEDGVGLQALTSPHLYGAADWGIRVLGVNLTYWEANVLYHAMFTVAVPVVLTGLAFPEHRGRPYLSVRGTAATAIIAVASVVALRFTVPPSQDPGYQAPITFVVGCVLAITILGFVALRVLPKRVCRSWHRPLAALPWFYVGSCATALAVIWLTFRAFGSSQPAYTQGAQVLIPMTAAVAVLAVAVAALRYCAQSTVWTRRHTLAVVGGSLVGHTVAGIAIWSGTTERLSLVVIAVVTAGLTMYGDRRLSTDRSSVAAAAL
ncbi:MAG: hypothetical protein ACOH2Q_10175 [Rhodococcus sp. (in: high G+C Gram-positive bacteria)]